MPDKPVIRADRASRWRSWLATWVAALLALAPAARPLPEVVAASLSRPSVSADDHRPVDAVPSATGLQSAQPEGLDVLSRLSKAETTFGPAPAKSTLQRLNPAASLALAAEPAGAPEDAARAGIDRGSVGTARTPTGPPS